MPQISGKIYLLNKLADLAIRCGISPAVANAEINFCEEKKDGWSLSVVPIEGYALDDAEEASFEKFQTLLGIEAETHQNFATLRDMEKVIDHALSLAPRARVR
jgi:hypothetical protein